MPGGPAGSWGSATKGVFSKKGAKPREHSSFLWPRGSPRPSQLVTEEKHAVLMQLGKCYFSNVARSSGLNQ